MSTGGLNDMAAGGPGRQSRGAWALITARNGLEDRWLARWNAHWGRYNFVGGHKHDGETYRDCVVRELKEELNLVENRDYTIVEPAPLASMAYDAWSASAGALTRYEMEVFGLVLREGDGPLATQRPVRWLTRSEIEAQRAADGAPVSETMKRVLGEMNWRTMPQDEDGSCLRGLHG